MNSNNWIVWFSVTLLFLMGCGGTKFRTGNKWDPNEEPFFDDGVDIVEDFSELSGKWAFDQEALFNGRVQLADLIAIVNIKAVQTASQQTIAATRIDVELVEILNGESPSDSIQLFSAADSMGNQLIQRYENRLTGKFLVFVRWFKGKDRSLKHHFHLSPASQTLVDEIKRSLEERKLIQLQGQS